MELKMPASESGWSKSGSLAPRSKAALRVPLPAQALQSSLSRSAGADATVSSLTRETKSRKCGHWQPCHSRPGNCVSEWKRATLSGRTCKYQGRSGRRFREGEPLRKGLASH